MMKILFCLLALGHVVVGKIIPVESNFKACHRSDPEINSCLLKQAEHFLRFLKNGDPQHKIQPLDPLTLESFTADADLENIKLKVTMSNITVLGHSDTVFHRIKFDPESLSGELSCTIPLMRFTCDYHSSGRLFVLPLESSAHFDANFTRMDIHSQFRLKTVERKGKEYLTIDKMTWELDLGGYHMDLVAFDPAQQPQVNLIRDFCNENFQLIKKTVNPIANEHGVPFYKYIVESFLRRIPAEELLPY